MKRNFGDKGNNGGKKRTASGLPKVYNHKKESHPWIVSWRHDGERDRWYFKSKAEAEKKCVDLLNTIKKEGAEGFKFGAVARAEYAGAAQILEPFGISVLEAARYYEKMHVLKTSSVTWKDAVFQLEENLELANRRPRTIYNLKQILELYRDFTEAETIADLTVENIQAFLSSGSFRPATVLSYRAALSNLGAFAVWKGWVKENPAVSIRPPKVDKGRPVVYTIDEANRLLSVAARIEGGRIVRRLALLLLCGLRPTEIDHLRPDDFRKDGIRIGTGKIRGRRAVRFLPYLPSFKAWWENFEGEIKPSNFRKLYEKTKALANVKKRGTKIERHTWISARLAVLGDENRVAREAGNSPDVIYNHYFQIMDEQEAAQLGAYCPIDIKLGSGSDFK